MKSSVEEEYVHNVYSRLASYQQKESASTRIWPNVRKFVESFPKGSCLLDVGCGEAKYQSDVCVVFGVDTCVDVLTSIHDKTSVQLILGDALRLPFRDQSLDGILLVSVLHHLSTTSRRKEVLAEAMRCLRYGGRMLICVWAFEQPNASFPSQDVLVPWKMHEQAINGRLPQIKFHMNSTKEQRIIEASIPIDVPKENNAPNNWFNILINKFQTLRPALPFLTPSPTVPPATPKLFPTTKTNNLLSGIRRWSPMLSRRIASLLVPVEEQLAQEITEKVMQEALAETLATTREVTFYRYYHVFRSKELESLLQTLEDVKIIQSTLEHANWCVVVEKTRNDQIRP